MVRHKQGEDDTDATAIVLGATTEHKKDKIEARKIDFEQAQKDDNKELIAIYYGDGVDLNRASIKLSDQDFDHVRTVADALRDVLRTLQQAKNKPDFVDMMRRVWQKYAKLLINEACAANVRDTLRSRGIAVEPGAPTPSKPTPTVSVPPPSAPVPVVSNVRSAASVMPPSVQLPSTHAGAPPQSARSLVSELRLKELESDFLAAYSDGDDDKIVVACNAIRAAGLQLSMFPRVIKYEERIKRAYQRKDAMAKLSKALQEGDIQEILAAYDSSLISDQLLAGDEQIQIACAQGLAKALKTNDDKIIQAEWEQKPDGVHIILIAQQRERIDLALERQQALTKFLEALKLGPPKLIVEAYTPILDNYPALVKSERERLSLARAFVDAYEHNDDDALASANEAIESSPYKDLFAFIGIEKERIRVAYNNTRTIVVSAKIVQNLTIAVMVEGKFISLEEIKKFLPVYQTYNHFLISVYYNRLQGKSDKEQKKQIEDTLKQLRSQAKSGHLHIFLLQMLVDDLLIQADITKKQNQEGIRPEHFTLKQLDLDERFMNFCFYMRHGMGSQYGQWLIDYSISEEDIKTFLQIPLRRELFAKYLLNQYERQELGGWLEKQRKKVKYGPDEMLDFKGMVDWLQTQFP